MVGQLSAPPIVGAAGAGVAPLASSSFALFLDVDGTLIDLAGRPEDVVTPPNLISTLKRAESTLDGALALISGRSIDDVDRIFAPLRLRASGVHGAEIRLDPDAQTIATAIGELPKSLLAALERATRPFPGVFVEDKRFSFTVHYRLAPSAEQPLRRIVEQLTESTLSGVEIMDAHYAIEIKYPSFDKGHAIAAFLSTPTFCERTPIFIGDDTTDESGFALVTSRGGLAYSVGSPRAGAILGFPGPRAVREWLAEFPSRGITA
jgi:trehalose 6-phosphate phosphatase